MREGNTLKPEPAAAAASSLSGNGGRSGGAGKQVFQLLTSPCLLLRVCLRPAVPSDAPLQPGGGHQRGQEGDGAILQGA